MLAPPASATSRRLLVGLVLFGLFVLFDIALFGWLIFRSLSQREIERALLETRSEAQTLADRIAARARRHGTDIFTAVALERETETYINSVLRRRDLVQTVEIRDRQGTLVYRITKEIPGIEVEPPATRPPRTPELPFEVPSDLRPPAHEERREKADFEFYEVPSIEVAIGELGQLQIGISADEIRRRTEVLRRELVRQAAWISLVTVVLLLTAYTALWRLLRRSQRAEARAAEAARLAYVGTLASGLAHEIRNPLNSLNLNMQMLEEEIDAHGRAPSGPRLLAITRAEIGRLERLVTDFLAYAKPRPLEREELPAAAALERAREVLAAEAARRGVELEVVDAGGGAYLSADPAQLHQALLNLARNALTAAEEAARPPRVRLRAVRQGEEVLLEVEDSGPGVAPGEEPRLFDLFYSTRKGGTGLGLAIADRIVRAHGGRIAVRGAPGGGAVFAIALPALDALREQPGGRGAAARDAETGAVYP
ncbi:MAG TPA: HAMP domain-containing sensor histidine kinase [Thermoanaerobaculia bacterium]|nr:HAMP domain-containing sensor histidine kinase [Thermoanaerobaculia bacterium]